MFNDNVINGYDKDSNVLLIDSLYVRPHFDEESDAWTKGMLYKIYRDLNTGEKFMQAEEEPKSSVFFTKPEYRHTFNTQRQYISMDKIIEKETKYRYIPDTIAREITDDGVDKEFIELYKEAKNTRTGRMKKELFKWRHNYYSDYDICDYTKTRACLQYKPENLTISKAFLDIETDFYESTPDEQNNGERPITAVTVVFPNEPGSTKKAKKPYTFTLLLRDHDRYPQQVEFEKNIHEFYGAVDKEMRDLYKYKGTYKVNFFDDEIEMLKTLFGLLHAFKTDTILIWNMVFDINYIIKRLQYLGYNPEDFFCHPDFKESYMYYYLDRFYKDDIPNRGDYFDCASYSRWMCQRILYAGVRKGKSEYGGTSLDNVSDMELGAKKREYDQKGVDVLNGAIYEYFNFALYSVNDVVLQYLLDAKTEDMQVVFEQSYHSGTRLSKTLKQSTYLKNVHSIEYIKMDNLLGNNKNIDYCNKGRNIHEYDDVELAGALVAKPLTNGYNGIEIFGKPSMFAYKLVIDLDYTALYPSIKTKFNISANTQHGRLILDKQIIANENPSGDEKFMRGGKFVDDLQVGDYVKVGYWFGLKSMDDYIEKFKKKGA